MISLDGSHIDKRAALSSFLMDEMAASMPVLECSREIAEAVATVCSEYYSDRALTADQVTLFVSKALLAVGEEDVAGEWLRQRVGDDARSEKLLIAVKHTSSLTALIAGLSGKVYRDGTWCAFNDGPVWVLDLDRISIHAVDALEVVYLRVLRTMLEGLVGVWAATSGQGTLMVRGLEKSVQRLDLAEKTGKKFIDEALQFMREFLAREQEHRGWSAAPRIIVLNT